MLNQQFYLTARLSLYFDEIKKLNYTCALDDRKPWFPIGILLLKITSRLNSSLTGLLYTISLFTVFIIIYSSLPCNRSYTVTFHECVIYKNGRDINIKNYTHTHEKILKSEALNLQKYLNLFKALSKLPSGLNMLTIQN